MFCIWVTLRIDLARRDEWLAAIEADATCSVRDEPGCVGFDVIELDAADGRYALYERYVDRAAFEQDHWSSPHFATYQAIADVVVLESELIEGGVLVDRHV